MTKTVRVIVILLVLVFFGVAGLIVTKFGVTGLGLRQRGREEAAIIRRPNLAASASSPESEAPGVAQNIAPLATVSASSSGRSADGVADGVVDTREWATGEEMGGAWIKLSWDRPAMVNEVALYDRPNLADNVLGGTLSLDDGSVIPVPALPPDGAPWRLTFPVKTVHWLMFRIDRAEGRNTGLAEIMVFGSLAQNLAPLAKVSVSSGAGSGERSAGATDGVVDAREWVAHEEMAGAWIKLSWDRPVAVIEIALYDRPSPVDNVLSGTLSFDDGTMIPVPALPPAGTPWRVILPAKTVNWVSFRIDRAQGRTTGLAKIMVFGAVTTE